MSEPTEPISDERLAELICGQLKDDEYRSLDCHESYEIDEALRELAAARKELASSKWVSVKDRLPDYRYVLMANTEKQWRDTGVYRGAGDFVDKYGADAHPTHWMPLPELPAALEALGGEA